MYHLKILGLLLLNKIINIFNFRFKCKHDFDLNNPIGVATAPNSFEGNIIYKCKKCPTITTKYKSKKNKIKGAPNDQSNN
jgi:hypothetical protein